MINLQRNIASVIEELPIDAFTHLTAAQQPSWPDESALCEVIAELESLPPLVFPEECDLLRARLAAVARGQAFLLQGGDCAETFDRVSTDAISGKLMTLLQMATLYTHATAVPVVKVGRIAGQYAKPRSEPTETRGGTTLPSYRGDAVNDREFTASARMPDPRRLRRTYDASAATLNLMRAFASSRYARLRHIRAWNGEGSSAASRRYARFAREVDAALKFVAASGVNLSHSASAEFYTSHEALLLDYEWALLRAESRTAEPYATSGHMLWIGDRTRQVDGAHVAFAATIHNPVAVKLGPSTTPEEAVALVDRLDPHREPGRLTFISRMGAKAVRDRLPPLLEKVTASGAKVVWACDPMHGNTFRTIDGRKTRRFEDVLDEVRGFFEVHAALGTHPGGLHLEFTGEDVTECLDSEIQVADLSHRYETACDPRLSRDQAIDLVFRLVEIQLPQVRPLH